MWLLQGGSAEGNFSDLLLSTFLGLSFLPPPSPKSIYSNAKYVTFLKATLNNCISIQTQDSPKINEIDLKINFNPSRCSTKPLLLMFFLKNFLNQKD